MLPHQPPDVLVLLRHERHAKDAIIGETLEGVVTAWNKGAEQMFGYAAEEIIAKPASILLPPDKLQEKAGVAGSISSLAPAGRTKSEVASAGV